VRAGAGLLLCAACATGAPPPLLSAPLRPPPTQAERLRVVAKARALLSADRYEARGTRFERDPVGFVRAAFWEGRIDLFDTAVAREASLDGLAIVYRSAANREQLHQAQPQAGDLLFLDGSPRSPLYPAGVAIVEAVGADGTVVALGHFLGGPRRLRLNLRNPAPLQKSRAGMVNPLLRGAETAHAAQLFRAFADPFG
jgi:hypothetical protein